MRLHTEHPPKCTAGRQQAGRQDGNKITLTEKRGYWLNVSVFQRATSLPTNYTHTFVARATHPLKPKNGRIEHTTKTPTKLCQRQEGCVGHLSHPAMESSSGWYRLAVVSSAPATGSPLVLLQQVWCVVCDCVSIGGVVSLLYETRKLWLRETWWRLQHAFPNAHTRVGDGMAMTLLLTQEYIRAHLVRTRAHTHTKQPTQRGQHTTRT